MDMDKLLDDDPCFSDQETSHFTPVAEKYGSHGRLYPNRPVASPPPASFVYNKADVHDARPVDMSLASSYLPGIYAMLKVLVLLSMLSLMQKLGMHIDQAIIVCAACLYIDRCTSLRYILDTGACALCVLISVCVNASRIGISGEPGLVNMSVSVAWVVFSVLILCDAHQPILRNVQITGIVHLLTSSFCAVHGFLSLDVEIDAVAYIRGVCFTALSVLWIYTLNLRERRANCNDSFSSCVDRFAVILVADAYVSGVYMALACVVIIWRYRLSFVPVHVASVPSQPVEVVCDSATVRGADRRVWHGGDVRVDAPLEIEYPYPEDMDVHVAFRLAQENARKGDRAR
ncbi:hypothetical protein T484DRAFT_1757010 [Baffinella frigidus]|nr:hypothetical protein T484DRAFT_1757010 [Cryptophyta sp. CCMP2293]